MGVDSDKRLKEKEIKSLCLFKSDSHRIQCKINVDVRGKEGRTV